MSAASYPGTKAPPQAPPTTVTQMDVEIWSDIACPWCYVGKRRFEAALARFEHRDDVRVTWRSFELDPSAPAERSGERAARLAEKYGITVERAREMECQMTETAAGEGLNFRFDIQRSGTTFDGHRLIHLAAEHDLQDAMKERLLRAYFSEGELMSDHDTLIRLATEVGLDPDETRQMLTSDRYADAVREDERTATGFGISAVPTFVIDRAIGASGAHPPEALLELLTQGWSRREPASVIAGGEACDVDGNC
jgi:predicted DsbA family dithiol-disulfide isomerase